MSSYNLPLEINYQEFETRNFAGANYLTGFPSIAAALTAQSYSATYSDARPLYVPSVYELASGQIYPRKDYVYMFKGLQCIYLAPGKAFVQGCDVRIYNKNSGGATHGVVAARVDSYDIKTGLMWFDAYSISLGLDFGAPETNKIPIANARVTVFNGKNIAVPGNRTVATGGTNATSDLDALNQFGSRNGRDVAEYMHDFCSPAEGPAHVFNTAGAYLNGYGAAQNDPTNHPGVIQLGGVTTANHDKTLILARNARAPSVGGSIGFTGFNTVGTVAEFDVWQPALSTATNEYIYTVGMYFINQNPTLSYLQFNYTRTLGTAWRIQGRMLSGPAIDTATATAVASGWLRFRIEFDGTTYTFKINGASVGTITAAALVASNNSIQNVLYFRANLTWVAGTSPTYDHDYFYFKKQFTVGRTG